MKWVRRMMFTVSSDGTWRAQAAALLLPRYRRERRQSIEAIASILDVSTERVEAVVGWKWRQAIEEVVEEATCGYVRVYQCFTTSQCRRPIVTYRR
jgi:hypothetical protein